MLGLAANCIIIPIKTVGIRWLDLEVRVLDIHAIQIRRRGRDAKAEERFVESLEQSPEATFPSESEEENTRLRDALQQAVISRTHSLAKSVKQRRSRTSERALQQGEQRPPLPIR